MADKVLVATRPKCDFCKEEAQYDARVPEMGCWANLCTKHFKAFGCKLGTGKGQKLLIKEETNGN